MKLLTVYKLSLEMKKSEFKLLILLIIKFLIMYGFAGYLAWYLFEHYQ